MADHPIRIALAGSGDLPLDRAARHVLPYVTKATKVLLRRPKTKGRPPGGFERMVAKLAGILGTEVEWCVPEGSEKGQAFVRDLDMVTKADYVITFFTVPTLEGGTGHVVEAAMSKGIPVEAWWITADGEAERIGEYNPNTDGP
jgi:hypothetical protein